MSQLKKKDGVKLSKTQIIGNIGLYYACYHLSRVGWNVMPTSRNARGIDIVPYSDDGSCFKGIQVKSLSMENAVPIGANLDKIMGDFWVIVNNVLEKPNAFVMLPSEVKEKVHRAGTNGHFSYWLEPKSYDKEEYREAWARIGRGDKKQEG
jgi:hypothetical protein